MQLYFSPLACSMASRIALYEAGARVTFVEVDPFTKQTLDGQDYLAVNALGLVPALRTAEGILLTENAAILQYIARKFPEARLAPNDELGRMRLQQWLGFISTELHKSVFTPLLAARAPDEAKRYALEQSAQRLDFANTQLKDRECLLDSFSVADAYLVTVLGWCSATPIDLGRWPALEAYVKRLRARPTVRRALSEEFPLYQAEMARVGT